MFLFSSSRVLGHLGQDGHTDGGHDDRHEQAGLDLARSTHERGGALGGQGHR